MHKIMTRDEIISYLQGHNDQWLFAQARTIRNQTIGSKVYLRGLIELSNRCAKDCLYCGIRTSNGTVERYELSLEAVLAGAQYALDMNYGSVVLQAGERSDRRFTEFIEKCVTEIKALSNSKLGITLSLGEQSEQTYRRWFAAGAHRYLLRIESSNQELYNRIHPNGYSWSERLECLKSLRRSGFQLGTGVMIGLPFQSIENLADDLLFLKELDVDMCGMGPYIEHPQAPLSEFKSDFERSERVMLALRMIALLRILMPTINIASTTALHALDPQGREKGVAAGANVLMPNVTPAVNRKNYILYEGKPQSDIDLSAFDVGYGEWGDSLHFLTHTRRVLGASSH